MDLNSDFSFNARMSIRTQSLTPSGQNVRRFCDVSGPTRRPRAAKAGFDSRHVVNIGCLVWGRSVPSMARSANPLEVSLLEVSEGRSE